MNLMGGNSRPPNWRSSPFYRVEQAIVISGCQEFIHPTARHSGIFTFYITFEQLRMLSSTTKKYQLRLYCTTSQYYIPGDPVATTPVCPIEFPPLCQVKVNNQVVQGTFTMFGKKDGMVLPVDITKQSRITIGHKNQVDLEFGNSDKKYYLMINLVEVFSVETLVKQLKKRVQSRESVISQMKATQPSDDDLQVGATRVSLRDPFSYTRLVVPCRAPGCVHIGCFDATCWYSMMEEKPTWLCPICGRELDEQTLVVDGYMQEILATVDEGVEHVVVEADGEWHTEDNRFGSVKWKGKHKASSNVIEILDSSDSEREQIPHQHPPFNPLVPGRGRPTSTPSPPCLIDLTLSDSGDEGPQRDIPPIPAFTVMASTMFRDFMHWNNQTTY